MTHDQMIMKLTEWRDAMVDSDTTCDELLRPLRLEPESPIYQTIWSLQGHYTRAVSALVGDHGEWLLWFSAENAMGAREYECCPGTGYPSRKIKTIADLAQLIQESK